MLGLEVPVSLVTEPRMVLHRVWHVAEQGVEMTNLFKAGKGL